MTPGCELAWNAGVYTECLHSCLFKMSRRGGSDYGLFSLLQHLRSTGGHLPLGLLGKLGHVHKVITGGNSHRVNVMYGCRTARLDRLIGRRTRCEPSRSVSKYCAHTQIKTDRKLPTIN